jgi:threonyl-tRNA synthetase
MTVGLKEFTVSTTQLDFAVPQRFVDRGIDCTFVDSDGSKQVPYVIHRAPLSTHERFASFLIERFGGAMPTWLAPVQVRLLPVGEDFVEYADKVCAELRSHMIRAEVDHSNDTLGKKIRQGTVRKIPNLLVLGANEVEAETVTVRRYGIQEQRSFSVAEFSERLLKEIKTRKHVKVWEDADALMA